VIRPGDRVFWLTCQIFTSLSKGVSLKTQLSLAYDELYPMFGYSSSFDSFQALISAPPAKRGGEIKGASPMKYQ